MSRLTELEQEVIDAAMCWLRGGNGVSERLVTACKALQRVQAKKKPAATDEKPSPRPWRTGTRVPANIYDADGDRVAQTRRDADGPFIVMCVNACSTEEGLSCIVCSAALDSAPESGQPPRCIDCEPTDEQLWEWERVRAAFEDANL